MWADTQSEQRSRSDLTSALSQPLLTFKKTIFRDIAHYILDIAHYILHITHYILHMPLIRFYVFAHYELGVHTT